MNPASDPSAATASPKAVDDTIEAKRLELDRFKAEEDARLQRDRLDLERKKVLREDRFRSNPALISAAISFAAVLVSGAQVWTALISKDKELKVTEAQSARDSAQRNTEQQRQWELSRAKLLLENKDALLAGDPAVRQRTIMIVQTLLPPEIASQWLAELPTPKPRLPPSQPASGSPVVEVSLDKASGDRQQIGVGQWQKFTVRVLDSKRHPVRGAKVAWQMPQSGSFTYVGETNEEGISTATNMYTSGAPGVFSQVAYVVDRLTPVGFTDASRVRALSKPVLFEFTQK